ncbi:MAG TPA: M42 family metallopeptidase [Planctomycetota bacterium]|nr:M42 family metallopeptidase [Planctomycetota bacterium]
MDRTEKLLQELTEAHGAPGHEAEVRAAMRRRLGPLGTLSQDRIGSLICALRGRKKAGPRVMLAAHMDEIGFMVRLVTEDGFLRFLPLGGWFDQVLLGQRVLVKTHRGDIPGVIGSKPPHLLPQEERGKVVEKKNMYIDIGATSKKEVEEAGVRVGDPVVPDSRFAVLTGGRTYLAKAFDDRVGCALLVEALEALARRAPPCAVFGAATVMEEVGLRGAKTSVDLVDPDAAVILESGIAGDVPGIKPEESSTRLGRGAELLFYDRDMIPNLKLRDLVIDTARKLGVPLQLSAIEGGATDGARIHLHKGGVPAVVLGVPARHIHSHTSIIHRADYDAALKIAVAVVRRLDAATVAGLTK